MEVDQAGVPTAVACLCPFGERALAGAGAEVVICSANGSVERPSSDGTTTAADGSRLPTL
jgi:hypothetical protein